MSRLPGKKALISGGARGIGYGIAERFLREGADIVLLDVRAEELEASAARLREAAGSAAGAAGTRAPQVVTVVCDLNDEAAVARAAEEAWSAAGGLDILVNNAGIATREPFTDIPYERWLTILNVNLNAMFRLSQETVRRMIEQGTGGAIVNMASKNGLAGSGMLAHYNASKGGVVLLTQSMAVELARYGIRVNAVAPGFIDTPLDRELKHKDDTLALTQRTPMGRLGTIEETANAFLFLASDEASYITGATLVVDGGHLAGAGEF